MNLDEHIRRVVREELERLLAESASADPEQARRVAREVAGRLGLGAYDAKTGRPRKRSLGP